MTKLPIYYDPRQVVPDPWDELPSSSKAAEFMQAATDRHADAIEVQPPVTIGDEALALAHGADYVAGVLRGDHPNGFGHRDPRVPLAAMRSCGSMVAATLAAICGKCIACSPTSGFHHAHRNHGGGYCTFNGLALAARLARRIRINAPVAILDLDWHYGDGTQSILATQIAAGEVLHITSGAFQFDDSAAFFAWLEWMIDRINRANPSVVLYQAGADMHKDDPLGGLLDDDEMRRRDRMVFAGVQAPIAWNLAGGYRSAPPGSNAMSPTVETHLATLEEAIAANLSRPAKPSGPG